ncbi:hypothetical protein CRE_20566 [Caenorhabditis remanei]|uniref:Uncharacterized protein n=1 Tax=Caenorhabditis remanei TaxID=31234 RepID=E3NHF3_CAERE|nr:hypothetical protein CRE_20566 [Caenorhabditis remanei]
MLQKMQVGEYELTVTDVTLIVVMLVALKRVLTWLMAGKVTEPKKYEVSPLKEQDMTMEEVQRMRQEEKRRLVVVKQKIYDLSGSQELYDHNRDVFEAKNGCGDEWEAICERKYPFVGKLVEN